MKKKFALFTLPLVALGLWLTAVSAQAKDALMVSVNADGAFQIDENGNPDAVGTYAIGTLKVIYVVNATEFPAGEFATFDLDWAIRQGFSRPDTRYPLTLGLRQVGSSNLILQNNPGGFLVTGPGDTGASTVSIVIPNHVAANPDLQVDGTMLVANLQLETSPRNAHLDTVTTVKVHLLLVHPDNEACLRALHFISDNDFTSNLSSSGVEVRQSGPNSQTRPEQLRDVILLANACASPASFDLTMALNPEFELQSAQAVRTTTAAQIFTDAAGFLAAYDDDDGFSNHGTVLCLPGQVLDASQSYVATVRMKLRSNAAIPPPPEYAGFTGTFHQVGSTSNCTDVPAGTLHSDVTPNPVSAVLPTIYEP